MAIKQSVQAAAIILSLSACSESGMRYSPIPTVEQSPIVIETPTPSPSPTVAPSPSATPSPTPSPSPTPPQGDIGSRIFVSQKIVSLDKNYTIEKLAVLCQLEATKAKVNGLFTALVASTEYVFSKKYSTHGYIYQQRKKEKEIIANNFEDLISGKNKAINRNASGNEIKNGLVWTGQKDFRDATSPDLNCNNWSSRDGYAITGRAGASGLEAIAAENLACNKKARVYCIEFQVH